MSIKDSLGDRMKAYEANSSSTLTRKVPVVIRLDGKAFHTFTKGMEKPYALRLINAMVEAATKTLKSIQGAKLAYVQSDEVSIVLSDMDSIETDAWFGYNVQKMTSIAAATMTYHFNAAIRGVAGKEFNDAVDSVLANKIDDAAMEVSKFWQGVPNRFAIFDARAFTVPADDVANCFLWRAKDWHRNSVQMLGQANFTHKQLHGKKLADIHEMLHTKGINWAKQPDVFKNGTFIFADGTTRTDALPNFEDINGMVEHALFPKVTVEVVTLDPETQAKMDELAEKAGEYLKKNNPPIV